MDILIALLVFVIIAAILLWLVGQVPLPEPTRKIVTICLVGILLIAFVVRFVGPYLGGAK